MKDPTHTEASNFGSGMSCVEKYMDGKDQVVQKTFFQMRKNKDSLLEFVELVIVD